MQVGGHKVTCVRIHVLYKILASYSATLTWCPQICKVSEFAAEILCGEVDLLKPSFN